MTSEEIHLKQRVLRTLLRHGRQNEGRLAAFCRRGVFMDSWTITIARLQLAGLVDAKLTGHGRARTLVLTEEGVREAQKVVAQREEKAKREILATAEGR